MVRRRRKEAKTEEAKPKQSAAAVDKLLRYGGFAVGGLVAVLAIVYLTTMLPGVSDGDSAELQYNSKILGVCHPPGYQIEVTFGKVFSMLPFGTSVAWRINFMMAVFGVFGCLAIYGAVRRITGFVVPGIVAAGTLGFSSIYWTHCLQAEAYVFYGAFLAISVYTFVRYIEGGRFWWLYLTALAAGICVSDRASELFVMPGFVLVLLFALKKIKWNRVAAVHFITAVVIFVLPFVYTVCFHLARTDKEYLHYRDNRIRDSVLSAKGFTEFEPRKKIRRYLVEAVVRLKLGMTYTKDAKFDGKVVGRDIDKYAWLLSGAGGFGNRYEGKTDAMSMHMSREQGQGTSIGLLGLVLGVGAVAVWRKNYGWVLLGVWFFAGNTIFILWHHRWDNLTFTIPGLIGLSILAGLGAVGPSRWGIEKRRYIFQLCCLLAPLFLLATNYRYMDMSTAETKKTLEYNEKIAQADWPKGCAFIDGYWPGMTLRYLFYVEAGRQDIHVVYKDDRKQWGKLIDHFSNNGREVFMRSQYLGNIGYEQKKYYAGRTKKEFLQLGFVRVDNPQR